MSSAAQSDTSLARAQLARVRSLPTSLIIGGLIIAIFVLIALTGPLWAPYGPSQVGVGPPFAPPGPTHLLGTDKVGRDLFSRIVYGADEVLFLSLVSTLTALILGGILGLASGLIGGWFDNALMRVFEVLISVPMLIFALFIVALGEQIATSTVALVGVIVLVYTPRIARLARTVAVELIASDYVTVARARPESTFSIVRRELLPNATGVLLVEFGVRAGQAPLLIGALGFLGLGAQPPTPEWGLMISENRSAIISAPLAVLAPALALAIYVIGLNLFTDGLARYLGRSSKSSPL